MDRQAAMLRNLKIPPYGYEMTDYRVEECGDRHFHVIRTYAAKNDGKIIYSGNRMAYHECTRVGPRGGIKTVYKNFW